jgi:hypothetical protein
VGAVEGFGGTVAEPGYLLGVGHIDMPTSSVALDPVTVAFVVGHLALGDKPLGFLTYFS